MGQRFQVYVRYNNGENLFAMHLQWCWGKYSIQRATQLLDFIKKDCGNTYGVFSKKKLESLRGISGAAKTLKALTQLNIRDGSFVEGHDLVDEVCKYYDEYKEEDYYCINALEQDNNDGFFLVDITEVNEEEKIIKYCFDLCEDEYNPISANRYFEKYQEDEFEDCSMWDSDDAAYWENIERQLLFIEKFELLNANEVEAIFSSKYNKEKNGVKVE